MSTSYKTIYTGAVSEIIVKKSRFIVNVKPVESEEDAITFINQLKKKYWDASHNCSAYVVGSKNPIMRCSDDGEPAQTAGKPMLDVILAGSLTNLAVVVTRYFGGTLLGTGGLVKAYQSATIEGLSLSKIITKELGHNINITIDYTFLGKLQHLFIEEGIHTLSTNYTELVTLTILVPISQWSSLENKITEHTNGSAIIVKNNDLHYGVIEGKIYLFN